MVSKDFFKNIETISEEKEIPVESLYQILEKAFASAFKKNFNSSSCRVSINAEKFEVNVYRLYKVVEELSETAPEDGIDEILLAEAHRIKGKANAKVGQVIEEKVSLKDFNRAAATSMKNIFQQSIIQLEREKAFEYFKSIEGEMIQATILDIKEEYVILNLGRGITTTLPNKELLVNDIPTVGQNIRICIKKVEQTSKGPKVFVSRNDRNLINRLLETYIPEIKDGIIEVKGIARDEGDRTKIAVYSNDPEVDAIGSCVGEGGTRIKEIVDALNGEKIDLYKWSNNIEETIANSLQPASVTKVLSVDPKTKSSVVIVPDDQLSLAIGKQGQNVRLAVQSCGWKIDIKSLADAFAEGLISL